MARLRPDFTVRGLGYKGYLQMLRDHHSDEFEVFYSDGRDQHPLVRSIQSVLAGDPHQGTHYGHVYY